jgi:hypothetical protein
MSRKGNMLAVLLVLSILALIPTTALAQGQGKPAGNALAVPVSGTFSPSATSGVLSSLGSGNFVGTFNIQNFTNQNGALMAVGTLVGTLTNTAGETSNVVVNNVSAAVTQATGSCSILSLTLGPLHLDLLGLVIDLNQVNLNITAVPGAGNLLGNLLCGIANLLNGSGGALGGIANLLNQLLGALGL